MSYPIDLDEYDETQLTDELSRRQRLRDAGMCDYCARERSTSPSCKFPERHIDPAELSDRARIKHDQLARLALRNANFLTPGEARWLAARDVTVGKLEIVG